MEGLTLKDISDIDLSVIADVSQCEIERCWNFYFSLNEAVLSEQKRRKMNKKSSINFILPCLTGKELDNAIIETFVRRDAFDLLGSKNSGNFFQNIAEQLIQKRKQQKTKH